MTSDNDAIATASYSACETREPVTVVLLRTGVTHLYTGGRISAYLGLWDSAGVAWWGSVFVASEGITWVRGHVPDDDEQVLAARATQALLGRTL